jgi:hypothetical protein
MESVREVSLCTAYGTIRQLAMFIIQNCQAVVYLAHLDEAQPKLVALELFEMRP